MTIDVDVGEVRSGIPAVLCEMGATIRIAQLGAADYLIAEGIGVERKSVLDLHYSIQGGRLWAQLRHERSILRRLYLVVEGPRLDDGSVSKAGVRGALLEIGDRGVTVIRTTDKIDSAEWITRLAIRAQRRGHVPRARSRRYARATNGVTIVAGVPGVGPRIAHGLIAEFGSVAQVAAASTDDLCLVRGVGHTLASRIHDALNRT